MSEPEQTSPETQVRLDYFTPQPRPVFPSAHRDKYYRVALICWFVPLLTGVCNFALWSVLRAEVLKTSGKVIVVGGIVAGVWTLMCGVCFVINRLSAGARPWTDAIGPGLGLLFLLFCSLVITDVLCDIAYHF